MPDKNFIAAEDFCISHEVQFSFIYALQESGLIEITTIENISTIPLSELPKLEQIIRLHKELDINLEGIEAISYLLERITAMQREIATLRNRLSFYEE